MAVGVKIMPGLGVTVGLVDCTTLEFGVGVGFPFAEVDVLGMRAKPTVRMSKSEGRTPFTASVFIAASDIPPFVPPAVVMGE